MYRLTGEYECKVDAKGRVRLPSALIRQMGGAGLHFTINRGFEKNLVLYPREVWNEKVDEINRLNIYNKKDRQAIRYFYRGATELSVDSADRVLMPKSLLEYAEVGDIVFLFAFNNQVEIWSKANYDAMIDDEPEDFSDLAEGLFGRKSEGDEN